MPWPNGLASRPPRADPAEDVVLAVFADLRRTLLECGREIGIGARVNAAVYRLCIEDPLIAAVELAEIENLPYGLSRGGCAEWGAEAVNTGTKVRITVDDKSRCRVAPCYRRTEQLDALPRSHHLGA